MGHCPAENINFLLAMDTSREYFIKHRSAENVLVDTVQQKLLTCCCCGLWVPLYICNYEVTVGYTKLWSVVAVGYTTNITNFTNVMLLWLLPTAQNYILSDAVLHKIIILSDAVLHKLEFFVH